MVIVGNAQAEVRNSRQINNVLIGMPTTGEVMESDELSSSGDEYFSYSRVLWMTKAEVEEERKEMSWSFGGRKFVNRSSG